MLFDPATFRNLDAIGIASRMQSLEVGGGGGSVARTMAERVGPSGSVLVTGIDTMLLVGCDEPNIDVRVHDIAPDPLDTGWFEVVHARLVLEHLPTRLAVVEKLVARVVPWRPPRRGRSRLSGWLCLPVERLLCELPEVGATFQAVIVAFTPSQLRGTQSLAAICASTSPMLAATTSTAKLGVRSSLPARGSRSSNTLALRQASPAAVAAGLISQSEWSAGL